MAICGGQSRLQAEAGEEVAKEVAGRQREAAEGRCSAARCAWRALRQWTGREK